MSNNDKRCIIKSLNDEDCTTIRCMIQEFNIDDYGKIRANNEGDQDCKNN